MSEYSNHRDDASYNQGEEPEILDDLGKPVEKTIGNIIREEEPAEKDNSVRDQRNKFEATVSQKIDRKKLDSTVSEPRLKLHKTNPNRHELTAYEHAQEFELDKFIYRRDYHDLTPQELQSYDETYYKKAVEMVKNFTDYIHKLDQLLHLIDTETLDDQDELQEHLESQVYDEISKRMSTLSQIDFEFKLNVRGVKRNKEGLLFSKPKQPREEIPADQLEAELLQPKAAMPPSPVKPPRQNNVFVGTELNKQLQGLLGNAVVDGNKFDVSAYELLAHIEQLKKTDPEAAKKVEDNFNYISFAFRQELGVEETRILIKRPAQQAHEAAKKFVVKKAREEHKKDMEALEKLRARLNSGSETVKNYKPTFAAAKEQEADELAQQIIEEQQANKKERMNRRSDPTIDTLQQTKPTDLEQE